MTRLNQPSSFKTSLFKNDLNYDTFRTVKYSVSAGYNGVEKVYNLLGAGEYIIDVKIGDYGSFTHRLNSRLIGTVYTHSGNSGAYNMNGGPWVVLVNNTPGNPNFLNNAIYVDCLGNATDPCEVTVLIRKI